MNNNKKGNHGRKSSKSDYMRQARKQRQQENVFFDRLESEEYKSDKRNHDLKSPLSFPFQGGDADEQ